MYISIKTKKHSDDYNRKAINAFGFSLLFPAATYGIKAILIGAGMPALQSTGSLVFYLIWGFIVLQIIFENTTVFKRIFLFELLYVGAMLINYYSIEYTRPFYEEYSVFLRQIIVVFIPAAAIISRITCFEGCASILKRYAIFGTYFMLIAYVLGYMKVWDYQYFGIQVSPFALIMFWAWMDSKAIKDFFVLALDFLLILLGGRQSLIVILVGVFLLYYSLMDNKRGRRFFSLIIISMLLLLAYFFSDYIIHFSINFLSSIGISSRNLQLISNGEFLSFTTRNEIYNTAISVIRDNPLDFRGLFGDRYFIRQYHWWIAYPHNIVLEFLIDFGVPLGVIISIFLLSLTLISIVKSTNEKKVVILILASLAIVRLLVSSSYMIEGNFYLLLGMLFSKKVDIEDQYEVKK